MSECIEFVNVEVEKKSNRNNPYAVRDIRVSVLEELVIVMCLFYMITTQNDKTVLIPLIGWIIAMILSIIESIEIWKRNK